MYMMEEHGQVFAVKEISALDPKAKREQVMLESVKHKHIIKYIRTFTEDDRLNIVMEYADRGSLTQMVRKAVGDPEMLNLFDDVVLSIVCSYKFSNESHHSLALIKSSHISLSHGTLGHTLSP